MNYDTIAAKGFVPWLPNAEASDLDAMHAHDVPLLGTFKMGRRTILFDCVTGYTDIANVWAYTEINEDELRGLCKSCSSLEELQDAAAETFTNQTAAVAFAYHDKITEWSRCEVDERGILSAVLEFMDQALHTEKLKSRPTQERVDATARTLEPA